MLEKTSKQNIQNLKAKVKTKQQQLYNKYSNHVFYVQATIIHNDNCDKIVNNQARNMCHLKPISHSVAESIKDTAVPIK